ncbi:hypothetical protein OI25_7935 (plasmid) [Paraburkholderia fungorum]|uniref:Secreted protein n=1 Tax=Paraburkholderia fungorum TaxID=134537 RepID=A0AAU8SRI9_9BURK|nr:hypothetical protein OI25_7935 [Paraburkholderia fungorum]
MKSARVQRAVRGVFYLLSFAVGIRSNLLRCSPAFKDSVTNLETGNCTSGPVGWCANTGAEVDARITAASSIFHFATVVPEAAALLALFAGTALWPGNAFTSTQSYRTLSCTFFIT